MHAKAFVFIEPEAQLIVTSADELPIVIGFVVIFPILIVAPALIVPDPDPILIVGAALVFPVPILISPSLFICVPKFKSADESVCASPIFTPRLFEFVALLIELPVMLISPTSILVVAVGPILIVCPDVPVVVLPILMLLVCDSKKLNIPEFGELIVDAYNVETVSVPCAVG